MGNYDPNEKGTIYYGTMLEYVEELDKKTIYKPRVFQEKYLSVSVSSFHADLAVSVHPDLVGIAKVFKLLGKADIVDNCLKYKEGYTSSLTYLHGFGPGPDPYYFSILGLTNIPNPDNRVTVVIDKQFDNMLVKDLDPECFEYLSSSTHPFIRKISPEMIVGWIVPDCKFEDMQIRMMNGKLRKRCLWKASDFQKTEYDNSNVYKYAIEADNVEMFIQFLNSKRKSYREVSKKHLSHILQDFDIDFTIGDVENLKSEILRQFNMKKSFWDIKSYRYLIS